MHSLQRVRVLYYTPVRQAWFGVAFPVALAICQFPRNQPKQQRGQRHGWRLHGSRTTPNEICAQLALLAPLCFACHVLHAVVWRAISCLWLLLLCAANVWVYILCPQFCIAPCRSGGLHFVQCADFLAQAFPGLQCSCSDSAVAGPVFEFLPTADMVVDAQGLMGKPSGH
jgi:hypothetical protein